MMGPYGAGQPGDDQWTGLVILVMTDDRIGAVNSMMTDDARFGHTSTVSPAYSGMNITSEPAHC